MRILDANNNELQNPDLELGYLKNDKFLIKHHDAVDEVKEKFHYEVEKTYPNGGQDLKRIIDVEAVPAKEAWDEYENILRYVLYSKQELLEIQKLKNIEKAKHKYDEYDDKDVIKLYLLCNGDFTKLSDETSLRMKSYYPVWEDVLKKFNIDKQPLKIGYKFRYQDNLVKVRQEGVSPMDIYPPSVYTASMYEFINEHYEGTLEDPIPYDFNMAVEKNKHYFYKEKMYKCIEDSINPLYSNPDKGNLTRYLVIV